MANIVPKRQQPRITRIEPAELAFDANGTPCSPVFGDVYHSAESGPGQTQHVFIAGNDLPRRWAGTRVFTILETGFGLGLNFLMTWDAWRADRARCERLHFVSLEKHPFARDALRQLHGRYRELAPLAARLQDAWPPLVTGLHRLHFDDGRITLTLAFGDVANVLPRLRLRADALYLDGFAPDRNEDMWAPRVMKALARLSRRGTTFATWSSAGAVRERLTAAGFTVEKRPGFGRKREMLCGRFAPRWPVRTAARRAPADATHDGGYGERHAIVIGGGLAGAAVCERLASRGWRIDLVERGTAPEIQHGRAPADTAAASRFAGIFHPHVSRDDCILSRIVRSGYLYALARWLDLERAGHRLEWSHCGVVQLDEDASTTMAALDYPGEYAQRVTRDGAAALTGVRLRSGGWWFPGGGWMRPASLVAAQIAAAAEAYVKSSADAHNLACAHPQAVSRGEKGGDPLSLSDEKRVSTQRPVSLREREELRPSANSDKETLSARERVRGREDAGDALLTLHYETTVDKIVRNGNEWRALTGDGRVIASAPVLILANSNEATRLASFSQPLARVRGQVTYVPADALTAPRTVITGAGHVLPEIDGVVITGSTYDRDDDPAPQMRGHEANLMRLSHLLLDASPVRDASELEGAAGFRAVAPDRLPLVGAVPDVNAVRARKDELAGAHLDHLPRVEGLYCITGFASRGLVWSALAGELIASMLQGEPLPIESDLVDALDPARFVLRQLRSGSL